MRKVWLASYPKSGNTWMRMLIAALSLKDGEPLDINALFERSGIASARGPFDHLTLIDSGLLTHEEIDALRPAIHAAWRHDEADEGENPADDVLFAKTHDAYTYLADGTPLLAGAKGADGAVLIVRDPRDVAPSFANHNGTDIDKAIARMANPDFSLCGRTERLDTQLRQRLLGWSAFNASWLDQRDLPVLLLRYEDVQADTAAALSRVMAFAGCPARSDAIARAVAMTDFAELTAQEAKAGFREAPGRTSSGRFFRRGKAGGWRDELTVEQVARIEDAHRAMMRRLGYPPGADAEQLEGAGAAEGDLAASGV
ncbi:MAG: sulfotransferase domain-containing protein [Rhizomicrobium sp.]